ncbi:HsdR family type I site-specific deoxyribonuclease [Streptomyces sp. NPDC041068]|uniref:type I restriction endonuclease subunit R n=1 Tax=Streptomyces sp. NPDC041068 TaxID=3155130 RepID=UPI0033FC3423
MSDVGQVERKAQDRVVRLFTEQLGYRYLGNWEEREGNANIEVDLLERNLLARGYDSALVTKAIEQLTKAAALGGGRDLPEANRAVFGLLRYGVNVKRGAGEQYETVWPIDWTDVQANDFVVVEEVTVVGRRTKRPDVVLYVNGLALVTLELKRSRVAVSEGIRQTIGNQKPDFIRSFFATVQLVLAGNDAEGLRYGAYGTPEKYWLEWKEKSPVQEPLDRALLQMCAKERLLELIHDFTVFDSGVRKVCRHNQYFGVKAAQERIARREGGIIWHTQGSGKSLTMVWLAKWIRENQKDPRVLLITDRTELDEQIEKVFKGVDEHIHRTRSGADLVDTLNRSTEWLICSLVHKFRTSADDPSADDDGATSAFIKELNSALPKDFRAKGNLFVFVDEAHRTQSGALHDAMKELLPDAVFIGFTGTPLLKADKDNSTETFGSFIHEYKFDEAVQDGVVLDLRYEARDIDQHLTSPAQVDTWFEAKTHGMTDRAKAELKKRWASMRKVVTSRPRAQQIVQDILVDMATKPRLSDGRGNAMLVAGNIYQACTFFELFRDTDLHGKCAIVTSYVPTPGDISKEDSGAGRTEKRRQYDIYRRMLADHFGEPEDVAVTKVEQFEQEVKRRFVEEPGRMRLLIVVDKLLTGFDAPSATYLYIDRTIRDHGLFQAICRVNRLDGDDKEYGCVVDYQDLFDSLESAITDYTSKALDGYERKDVQGLLANRVDESRKRLDSALHAIRKICAPVAPPRNTLQYLQHFCAADLADPELKAEQLKANEPGRVELYKAVASLTRAYGDLANDMAAAKYSADRAEAIRKEVRHYASVRDEVKLGAGERTDFKRYEADMRFLLDTYVQAGASRVVADFEGVGLIRLLVSQGAAALDKLPAGIRNSPEAVTETLTNTMRRKIADERPTNPKYYDRMSALLDAAMEKRREGAVAYEQYLAALLDTATRLGSGESDTAYPDWADNGARKALVDFFRPDDRLAADADTAVLGSKQDSWIDNPLKERKVRIALRRALPDGFDRLDALLDLVKARPEYR